MAGNDLADIMPAAGRWWRNSLPGLAVSVSSAATVARQ